MRKLPTLVLALIALSLNSCMTDEEKEERGLNGPTTTSDTKPWSQPVPGQGGGAFGALPKQERR